MVLGLTAALAGGADNAEAKPKRPDIHYTRDQLGDALVPEDFNKHAPKDKEQLQAWIDRIEKILHAIESYGEGGTEGTVADAAKVDKKTAQDIFERARLACNALRAKLLDQKDLLDLQRQKDFDDLTDKLDKLGLQVAHFKDFADTINNALSSTGRKKMYQDLRQTLARTDSPAADSDEKRLASKGDVEKK